MQVLERGSVMAYMFLLAVIVASIYVGVAREGKIRLEDLVWETKYDIEKVIDFEELGIEEMSVVQDKE